MRKPFITAVVVAASVWAVTFALPATAVANNAVTAPAATSADVTARAQTNAPTTKRVRRTSMRRVAAVAAPAPYHSQCFLFWCPSGGRHLSVLMLGIGF
jgi:hypothetical protein